VIVVVGTPAWRTAEPAGPAGRACGVAVAAAARGARVEMVGRAGDDANGDALMLALAKAGVGHVAMLRDPARPTPVVTSPDVAEDAESVLDDEDEREPAGRTRDAPATAPGPRLEARDVELGLQYLTTFSVLVVADDVPPSVLPVAVDAAAFAGAHLLLIVAAGTAEPGGLPGTATALAAPERDPDGVFAALVGGYAAALDGGAAPADAFAGALAAGWSAPAP